MTVSPFGSQEGRQVDAVAGVTEQVCSRDQSQGRQAASPKEEASRTSGKGRMGTGAGGWGPLRCPVMVQGGPPPRWGVGGEDVTSLGHPRHDKGPLVPTQLPRRYRGPVASGLHLIGGGGWGAATSQRLICSIS